MIELLKVPSILTIQDSGRKGYRKLGIPVSGYMDDYSARIANYLVGNKGDAPLLEFLLTGPTIRFKASTVFAVTGDVEVRLNGIPVEPWTSHWVKSGDILEVGIMKAGLYGYIAFAGGVKCEKLLGSCSTYHKAGLGRPLREGDRLSLGYSILTGKEGRCLPDELRPDYSAKLRTVRVILGPDLEHFTENGVETFLSETYTVTTESDRMGYRLDGKEVEHSSEGADIVTGPLVPGSIQVPADGRPVVVMKDAQTTGGYARIGSVISPDLHLVAQTKPGNTLHFRQVDVRTANEILRKYEKFMNFLRRALGKDGSIYRIKTGGETFITLTYHDPIKG